MGFVVFRDYVLVYRSTNFPWAPRKNASGHKEPITPKPIRFVCFQDTHYHADHTLGNSCLSTTVAIVARMILRLELGTKGMEDVKDQTKITLEHLKLPSIRFQESPRI